MNMSFRLDSICDASKKTTYPNEEILGTSGLHNLGNTCYMNSIVQCLSNCEEFRQYILSNNLIPDLVKNNEINQNNLLGEIENNLSFQLRKILINIWNSSFYAFRPVSFKKLFGKKIEMFQNSSQHDSQEALLCILDTFNEEIGNEIFIKSKNSTINEDKFNFLLNKDELTDKQTNHLIDLIKLNQKDYINYLSKENFLGFYKKKYSIICNIFGGRIISELKCPVTEISKINFEPFFFLSLSIPEDEEQSEDNDDEEEDDDEDNDDDEEEDDNEDNNDEDNEEEDNDEEVKDEEEQSEDNDEDEEYEDEEEQSEDNDDDEEEEQSEDNDDDEEDDEDDESDEVQNDDKQSDEESYGEDSDEIQIIELTKQNVDEDGYFDEDYDSENDNKSINSTKSDSDLDIDIEYLNRFNFIKEKKKKIAEFTLEDCLDKYFQPEILDDDNRWHSPYCNKKVNAIKNIQLWELPNILIIHLKRFKKTMYGNAEKMINKISFPLEGLNVSKYYHKLSKCDKNIYDLFAINNHTNFNKFGFNGISFGHYYSYCKNITNNKWYQYNDDKVKEINLDELISPNAYILFYKLRE